MKKYYLLIMILFTFNLFSQTSGWMPVTRITNSKTQDRHPSIPKRFGEYLIYGTASEVVFDRADSIGTNICAIRCINGNWSNEIQYITTGKGIKEYPCVGDSIVVFHQRDLNYSNLYYCIPIGNGWSEPVKLTNDTNKHNLYPKILTIASYNNSISLLTWEKDNKIFFNQYDGKKWNNEIKVSPYDSSEYSNPDISIDSKIAVLFEKRINENNIQIILSHIEGNIITIDTVYTQGINRNPKFLNGWGQYLTWENKIFGNWQILKRKTSKFDSWHIYSTILSDSINNYHQFTGFFADYLSQDAERYKNRNFNLSLIPGITTSIYLKNNANSSSIILDGESFLNTNHTTGKNGVISSFKTWGGNRVWAVWESEIGGYSNLYGSYINLFPTKANETIKPFEFSLNQNYPNPFNPSTVISYSLEAQGLAPVQIKIYDILGREVKTLVDEYKPAGEHKVIFDAKGLSEGVYFYRLNAGGRMETRKMALVK